LYSTVGIQLILSWHSSYRHCKIAGRDRDGFVFDANAIATEPELLRPLINESWQVILLYDSTKEARWRGNQFYCRSIGWEMGIKVARIRNGASQSRTNDNNNSNKSSFTVARIRPQNDRLIWVARSA